MHNVCASDLCCVQANPRNNPARCRASSCAATGGVGRRAGSRVPRAKAVKSCTQRRSVLVGRSRYGSTENVRLQAAQRAGLPGDDAALEAAIRAAAEGMELEEDELNELKEEIKMEFDLDVDGLEEDEELIAEDIVYDLNSENPPGHKSGYIAIVGRPNAGKSSLMNILLGRKLSIVTYKPQTTRHRILGIVSEEEFQMILLDTPGVIDKRKNKMEKMMMRSVWGSVKDADIILAMVDAAGRAPKLALQGMFPEGPQGIPLAIALNKTDKVRQADIDELVQHYQEEWGPEVKIFPTSTKERTGLRHLGEFLLESLPLGPCLYPKAQLSEHPERFFMAEIIREQVFLQYRQEVPYAVQVVVLDYAEREEGKDYIEAEVTVEKDSHKMIIIGSKGAALKKLSTQSRIKLEEFLGVPLYLQLLVKTRPGWREHDGLLESAGMKNASTAEHF